MKQCGSFNRRDKSIIRYSQMFGWNTHSVIAELAGYARG